jgi:type IV secretion system protein VirB10
VASLPSNYSDLPKPAPQLGPPLPGDLGPPILHAEQDSNTSAGTNAANQQLIQEQDSARTSSLFVQTASASTALQHGQAGSVMPGQSNSGTGNQPAGPSSDHNMQDQKLAFLTGPSDAPTVSSDRLTPAVSPYIIQAGTVIPAALITGIESDLPGRSPPR